MSFTNSNDYITGRKPVPTAAGGETLVVRFTLAVATADLALNTIGQVGILPAGHVPVEVRIDSTDIDSSTAAAVIAVGIWDGSGASLSTDAIDGGGLWGDTGGVLTIAFDKAITRLLNNMATVGPSSVDRKLGLKVTTAPTTAVAGTIGVTLTYRPA